jgi:FemAB-related protein (PEP-CTERM system-associated)
MTPKASLSMECTTLARADHEPILTCREFCASDRDRWDQFVLAHEHGSPFHLVGWKITIEESFGYEAKYLLVERGDTLCAIVPLFFVKNPIIGKVLLSSPFAVYGGILSTNHEAKRLIGEKVRALGAEMQVDYIELRNSYPEQCIASPNVSRYVAFSQQLVKGDEAILGSIPKKTRNLVRKALKTPFDLRRGVIDTAVFESLYSTNMRRLGTPSFPRKYFARLMANLGAMIDVSEVWFDGKPMAASLCFLFRGDMHIYYAAADAAYNHLGANTFMYFDHLRWGAETGLATFDFGRCKKNTGVFEFKRHWNTTMRELPYEILLIGRESLPNVNPGNPKFHFAIRVWQLMPLWFTRFIGPRFIRLFP